MEAIKTMRLTAIATMASFGLGASDVANAWSEYAIPSWNRDDPKVVDVLERNQNGGETTRFRVELTTTKQITGVFMGPLSDGVYVLSGERLIYFVSERAFKPASVIRDPGVLAKAGEVATPVSNDADSLDLSCDGRFAVVVGGNSATPVSLVDVGGAGEVATVAYANKLARAAAIGDDGSSVLVVLDNPSNTNASTIRRLILGPTGTLVDAGEQLSLGTDYVTKVRIAPGSKIGVALIGLPARIVAFRLPGLTVTGSVTLANAVGNGIAVSPSGDRVYARSGNRGIAPDVIEGFALDPVNGTIAQAPVLRIDNIAGFTGVAYNDPIAISNDGASLVVAEESFAQPPVGRVAAFSTSSGALVATIASGGQPQIVAALRRCGAKGGTETLIEYHHAAFDHYFVTGIANEITMLDNGTFAGWARTGERLNVHASGTASTAATCRFFSASFAPKSSHFYAPSASECATVKANQRWQFEGEVFNVALPAANGSCTPPALPLYRVYNNGQSGAPNHRYTTRLDLRDQMMARGWVPEGLGAGVVACVPP